VNVSFQLKKVKKNISSFFPKEKVDENEFFVCFRLKHTFGSICSQQNLKIYQEKRFVSVFTAPDDECGNNFERPAVCYEFNQTKQEMIIFESILATF